MVRGQVIGVNHYYRSVVGFGINHTFFGAKDDGAGPSATNLFIKLGPVQLALTTAPRFEKNDMQWDLTPSSMHRLLLALWERYHVPLFITESGCADGEVRSTTRYSEAA